MPDIDVDFGHHRRRVDLLHGITGTGQQQMLPHPLPEHLRSAREPRQGLRRRDGLYAQLPEVSGIDSACSQLRERVEIGLSGIDRGVLDGLMRGRHKNDRKC